MCKGPCTVFNINSDLTMKMRWLKVHARLLIACWSICCLVLRFYKLKKLLLVSGRVWQNYMMFLLDGMGMVMFLAYFRLLVGLRDYPNFSLPFKFPLRKMAVLCALGGLQPLNPPQCYLDSWFRQVKGGSRLASLDMCFQAIQQVQGYSERCWFSWCTA